MQISDVSASFMEIQDASWLFAVVVPLLLLTRLPRGGVLDSV